METILYRKRNATELPKESGHYIISKSDAWFNADHPSQWSNKEFACWFEPAPLVVSLEEAKDETAKKYGYADWLDMKYNWKFFGESKSNEAAELYLSSNMAKALREVEDESAELRSLKQSLAESGLKQYFPKREMSFHDKVVLGVSTLESEIAKLREALEKLKIHLATMGFKDGSAESIIESALSTTKVPQWRYIGETNFFIKHGLIS